MDLSSNGNGRLMGFPVMGMACLHAFFAIWEDIGHHSLPLVEAMDSSLARWSWPYSCKVICF